MLAGAIGFGLAAAAVPGAVAAGADAGVMAGAGRASPGPAAMALTGARGVPAGIGVPGALVAATVRQGGAAGSGSAGATAAGDLGAVGAGPAAGGLTGAPALAVALAGGGLRVAAAPVPASGTGAAGAATGPAGMMPGAGVATATAAGAVSSPVSGAVPGVVAPGAGAAPGAAAAPAGVQGQDLAGAQAQGADAGAGAGAAGAPAQGVDAGAGAGAAGAGAQAAAPGVPPGAGAARRRRGDDPLMPDDPAKGFNRVSYAISQPIDRFLFRPAAMVYAHVVPRPLRDGARNFLDNLFMTQVLANDILQLRPKRAVHTIVRFLVNTTLGIGGIFDIAKRKPFHLPAHPNSLGDTFGYYGIKSGPYLYLPILGPTTLRDLAGSVGDAFTQPLVLNSVTSRYTYKGKHHLHTRESSDYELTSYGVAAFVVGGLDKRARADAELRAFKADSVDPYAALRSAFLQDRAGEIAALKAPGDGVPGANPDAAIPAFDDPLADPGAGAGTAPGGAAGVSRGVSGGAAVVPAPAATDRPAPVVSPAPAPAPAAPAPGVSGAPGAP